MRFHRAQAVPAGRRPKVFVVVPCHNYGRFLPQCVGSVLDQPGVDVEVLIIDDLSTDDSADVARALSQDHAGVSALVHEVNRGHIATYNEGLARADSDYVVLLSADDLVAPGAFTRAAALFAHHPEVGLVYGRPMNFSGAVPAVRPDRLSWTTWPGQQWISRQYRRGLSAIYSPEAIVRTSVHHEVGYYDPGQPYAGDVHMWLRIAAVSDVGRVNGAVQGFRRIHGASMTDASYDHMFIHTRERVKAYSSFLADRDDARARDLRRLMARRATEETLSWALTSAHGNDHATLTEALALVEEFDPDAASRPSHAALRRRIEGRPESMTDRLRGHQRQLADASRWRLWHHLGI